MLTGWLAPSVHTPRTGRTRAVGTRRTLAWALALAVLATLVAVVVPAVPAAAQEAVVRETGSTEWEVRPNDGRADVTVTMTLQNQSSGSLPGYGIYLPMRPDRATVSVDGRDVASDLVDEAGLSVLEWDLPGGLASGASSTVAVDLRFPTAPPRTGFADGPRISNGYVAVPIWAWGFDAAELVVRVPARMNARLADLEPTVDDEGWAVFTTGDAGTFSAVLVGASDGQAADARTVQVEDTTVTIAPWPDDPEWGDRVEEFAATALPALAEWTGTPWDGTELTIRETATPVVEGWGGWNDGRANVISIGEEFDRALWTHELSHNWFNHAEFSEPWLIEGLAETVTARLADDLDIPNPPVPTDDPPTGDRALLWWDYLLSGAGGDVISDPDAWYDTTNELYDGAHYVVDAIADEIGDDAFRRVVSMTLREQSAWGRLGTPVADEQADWREFLDLAERVGKSEIARDLLVAHVTTDVGPELEARDRAIAAWLELAREPWGVPAAVRTEMHHWRFDQAQAAMGRARTARSDAVAVIRRARELGLAAPDLRTTWDTATFEALDDQVTDHGEVLTAVAALHDRARAADLPVPALAIDPAVDEPEAMHQVVRAATTALSQYVAAESALDRAEADPLASIGLSGTDPAALRERARTALAEGDVGVASTATRQLRDVADGAMGRALLRVGAILLGALAVLALLVVVVRGLRRRRTDDAGAEGESGPAGGLAPPPPSGPALADGAWVAPVPDVVPDAAPNPAPALAMERGPWRAAPPAPAMPPTPPAAPPGPPPPRHLPPPG